MDLSEGSSSLFKICSERRLAEYLRMQDSKLETCIDRDSVNGLSNINDPMYIQELVARYSLAVPYLHFDNIAALPIKRLIPADRFPPNFDVSPGHGYEKQVVIFHIRCSGDPSLLMYYSDDFIAEGGPSGFIRDDCLCFEIINFFDDLERVKKIKERIINEIKTLSGKLIEKIESYNQTLQWKVHSLMEERSHKLSKLSEILGTSIMSSIAIADPSRAVLADNDKRTTMQNDTQYDVFLSYASADSKEARQIFDSIRKIGGTVFLSEKSLQPGEDFAEAIRMALQRSTEIWLLLSPNSLKSEWVITEWGAAWALEKRIIPILFRCDHSMLPARIGRLQCLDFHEYPERITQRFSEKSTTDSHSKKTINRTSQKPFGIGSSPTCPNCSTSDRSIGLNPIPPDFIEIENATHECSRCGLKTRVE